MRSLFATVAMSAPSRRLVAVVASPDHLSLPRLAMYYAAARDSLAEHAPRLKVSLSTLPPVDR